MKTDKSKTKPIMFLKIDFEFSFFPGFVCESFCKKSSAMKKIEHFIKTGERMEPPSLKEKIELLKEHLDMEIALRGNLNGIKFFRKFYTYYIFEIKNAASYRGALVREENYDNIVNILNEILSCAE